MEQHNGLASGLRKRRTGAPGEPLRVLVADDDATLCREIGALLTEKYAPALAIAAGDVPSAIETLLVRHPDLVVTDLRLSGHPQGGFRLVLDAVSLGVPVVVASGPLGRSLSQRLDELGVGWVQKGSSDNALFAAIDRALSLRTRGGVEGRPGPRGPASGPRMHTA